MEAKTVLCKENIDVSGKEIGSKEKLFDFMAEMLLNSRRITDKCEFIKALYEREKTGSTYMGMGLAIPHGKSSCVQEPSVAISRFQPFLYDKKEGEMVHIAVLLAIPDSMNQKDYIKSLADTATLLADETFFEILSKETDKNIILEAFTNGIA